MEDKVDPPAKTREVFKYLKSCAKDMRTVTHKKFGDAVGLIAVATGRPLGYIRDHICIKRKLPFLNFIAVQLDSLRPGKSYLPKGLTVEIDDEVIWRGMVLQVFAYNWESVEFNG